MRWVVAVLSPGKLRPVQDALARIGVERMTVCDALGYGQQRGRPAASPHRAPGDAPPVLLRKVVLEIAVNEDFLEKTIQTIQQVARSGQDGAIGDGKIFVLPLEEVVRLSDTIRGPEAVS